MRNQPTTCPAGKQADCLHGVIDTQRRAARARRRHTRHQLRLTGLQNIEGDKKSQQQHDDHFER